MNAKLTFLGTGNTLLWLFYHTSVSVSLSSVSVSLSLSAQGGIVALGKAHTRSAPSLSSLPKVALLTEPIFVWLNTDRSQPWRVECRPLPFSTPLSFRRSYRLVGLVVKASASRAEDPGFESRLRRDFFGVEAYQ